jgi:hypothetical protein
MAFQYTVVPFVGKIKTGFMSTENAQTVSDQLRQVINGHATKGWEFVSVEKVDIEVRPGCIGALFGQKVSYISFDQVIFRAPV